MNPADNFQLPKITLNNSVEIPQIGLGLWKVQDKSQCVDAINSALSNGYTHFDSAQIYGNEKFLGETLSKAIKKSSELNREDLFITTKLWNDNQDESKAMGSFEMSLINLETEYVDLFLIHFPVSGTRQQAWKIMEEIYASGRANAIGVSNYTIAHLEELINSCGVVPAVNQVEIHVFLQQKELREYCKGKGIVVEAYSPLAHGFGLDNKDLIAIGQKYGKSSAQIMLRWCVQNEMVVLPKSVNEKRIVENAQIFDFELSSEDLEIISQLESNHRTCWDPTDVK